jgi:hypothetical protein
MWVADKKSNSLLPKLLNRGLGFTLFLHDLCDSHFKVFLCDVDATLSKSEHPGFGTHGLDTWGKIHTLKGHFRTKTTTLEFHLALSA